MRLVDADEIVEALDEALKEQTEQADPMDALKKRLLAGFAKQVLSDAPTVDAEPVLRGRWLKNGDRYCECSVCHREGNISGHDNYCWFCGAKMDEVKV